MIAVTVVLRRCLPRRIGAIARGMSDAKPLTNNFQAADLVCTRSRKSRIECLKFLRCERE
jgi:hypothetical protein